MEQAAVHKPLTKATFSTARTVALWDKVKATLPPRPVSAPSPRCRIGLAHFVGAATRRAPTAAGHRARHRPRCPQSDTCQYATDNAVGGALFFKHMTLEQNLDDLLKTQPELENVPVNKNGQDLRGHQAAHLSRRQPAFGTSCVGGDSYEKRRLRVYERLLGRRERATASHKPTTSRARSSKR